MAKIVITNQSRKSGGNASRTQMHFLDVWGEAPPSGKIAGLSIATATPPSSSSNPTGAKISRYQSVKSTLINWGLIFG